MNQPTTALTAEQIAQFHDELEEQQDEILTVGSSSWRTLIHHLPRCFQCPTTPREIRISAPEVDSGPTTLAFEPCGLTFHATPEAMAAGLRIHNTRRQTS